MPIPVSIQEFTQEMSAMPDEMPVYLNRNTGEFFAWNEEWSSAAEQEDLSNYPDWEREVIVKYREVCDSDDRLPLPSQFELDEWGIMSRFCEDVGSESQREALLDAIQGRGAFRRFKDTAARLGVMEQWYAYRDNALREIAVEWLRQNKIPYTLKKRTPSTE